MSSPDRWQAPIGPFSFGIYSLDPARRTLEREGERVEIGGRALDILVCLVERAPRLVDKADLLKRVWPGLSVDEGALRFQLAVLRRVLGDGRGNDQHIATVKGRGYAFVAPVVRSAAPLASPRVANTNLSKPPHPLVGRDQELIALTGSLMDHRLVTLVGVGGVGKTRLATELGWRLLNDNPDGVWQIDLAPLSDPALVLPAVVLALKLGQAETAEDVATAIGGRRMLVIFDNCEHLLVEVARLIRSLTTATASPTFLATSQARLGVAEERVHWLAPLTSSPVGAADVASYSANALFVARAEHADQRFVLTTANADTVGDICRRLDGVPLALEMAAARVSLLGVEGLRTSLDARLTLLQSSDPSRGRYRSLRDLVEWSSSQLDEPDQQTFWRLSIFPGPFSLDAAVQLEANWGRGRWETVNALGRLHEKSLITSEGDPPRYRLLETLRIWAREQLVSRSEPDAVAEAHATIVAEFMERADASRLTVDPAEWLRGTAPELDNVRTALNWALAEPSRQHLAAALAGFSLHLFRLLRLDAEARIYSERALAALDEATSGHVASRVWFNAGWFMQKINPRLALMRHQRAAALARQVGDPMELAFALNTCVSTLSDVGEREAAAEALRETRALLSDADRSYFAPRVELNAGILAMREDKPAEAARCFRRGVELARRVHDRDIELWCFLNIPLAEFAAGACAAAAETAREFIGMDVPDDSRALMRIHQIGFLAVLGDFAGARAIGASTLEAALEMGSVRLQWCLLQWTLLAALEGRVYEAARLRGFIDAEVTRQGQDEDAASNMIYEHIRKGLLKRLSDEEVQVLMAEGAKWSEIDALAYARHTLVG